MATKKQKHAEALAKREAFLENIRLTGQQALQNDRKQRKQKELQEWQEQHDKKHSWKKRIVECPHCRIEIHQSRGQEAS